MPNAPTSKAVLAVPTVGDQWHRKRVSRKLDDRDQVLEEAIQLVEEWPAATYPYIVSLTDFDGTAAAPVASAAGGVLAIGGVDFSATSSISVVLGSTTLSDTTTDVSAQTINFGYDVSGLSAGQYALVVRVDNVMCPVVYVTVS